MELRATFDQVKIVVDDMEAMAVFYGKLGIRLSAGPPEWVAHHRNGRGDGGADLELDSPAFAATWNHSWPPTRAGIVLGFHVPNRDDVDALYEELTTSGHAGQQPPYDAFWGARFAVVTDPDGNAVGLMSPSDPAFVSPPPPPPS